MKKVVALVLIMCCVMALAGCGDKKSESQEQINKEESAPSAILESTTQEETESEISAIDFKKNGIGIDLIGAYASKDSNGENIVALEFLYSNETPQPLSFMSVGMIRVFQNGVEQSSSQMYLENDYDWDTFYTEVKDGGEINVFHAFPINDINADIEVVFEFWDEESSKIIPYKEIISIT